MNTILDKTKDLVNTAMAPSIPKTCKACVIEKANAPWTIKEVPVEEPKQGEILIKVHACGVCHSDSFLQKGLFGPMYEAPWSLAFAGL